MLQPVPLRGAGGHSRQWAEPCWRFTHRLAQPPPTLPLPFIFPFTSLHHFLPTFLFSLPLPPSACPHRQWQPKILTSTRCTAGFFSTGSPPHALFFLQHIHPHQTEHSWTHLRSHKALMITVLVRLRECLHMGRGKEVRGDFLQQRHAGHHSDWPMILDKAAQPNYAPTQSNLY